MQFSRVAQQSSEWLHHSDWTLPGEEIELGASRPQRPGGKPNPINTSMVLTPLALDAVLGVALQSYESIASFRLGPLAKGGNRTRRAAMVNFLVEGPILLTP